MKLIIIEGGDRLGKSTLIEGICKHFKYDNVTIRHFGKPPRGLTSEAVSAYQFKAFDKEKRFLDRVYQLSFFSYYPEIVIWNRSYLGEYVYSQMFRNGNPEELKTKLLNFERGINIFNTCLITLTASPEFFLKKEDGNSFSRDLSTKTKELELFKEIHELSRINCKKIIKVDHNGEFWPKQTILDKVLNVIDHG